MKTVPDFFAHPLYFVTKYLIAPSLYAWVPVLTIWVVRCSFFLLDVQSQGRVQVSSGGKVARSARPLKRQVCCALLASCLL